MILVVTGHRPKKLAKSIEHWHAEIERPLLQFTKKKLREIRPQRVLTGMAAGFDLLVGLACLELGCPYWACVPHRTQPTGLSQRIHRQYMTVFNGAERRELIERGEFHMGVFDKRNEWMVDRGDRVLALWNGSDSGTGNCVRYAQSRQKPVDDVWEEWEKYRDSGLFDII